MRTFGRVGSPVGPDNDRGEVVDVSPVRLRPVTLEFRAELVRAWKAGKVHDVKLRVLVH